MKPLGSEPNGSIFLPSCSTYKETRVQLPWTCLAKAPVFSFAQTAEAPDHTPPKRMATASRTLTTSRIDRFMVFLLALYSMFFEITA